MSRMCNVSAMVDQEHYAVKAFSAHHGIAPIAGTKDGYYCYCLARLNSNGPKHVYVPLMQNNTKSENNK